VFRNTELLLSRSRRGGPLHAKLPASGARLRALAADAARELDVLGLDRHALRVDRAEVRVLEEADEVRLRRLLQREHRGALEAQVRLELLRDLAHEALEGELADEQLRRLLVAPDLAERDGARSVPVRLLHAARRLRAIAARQRARTARARPPPPPPPARTGADLRAALVASALRGALPPVDLRAVCFVRAM
jgi:hypothetical protein